MNLMKTLKGAAMFAIAIILLVCGLLWARDNRRVSVVTAQRDSVTLELLNTKAANDTLRVAADGAYLKLAQMRSMDMSDDARARHWQTITMSSHAQISAQGAGVLPATVTYLTADSDSIREADFHEPGPPLKLDLHVTSTPHNAQVHYAWSIAAVPIQVEVGCVRAGLLLQPEVALHVPRWVRVDSINSSVVAPNVCNVPVVPRKQPFLALPLTGVAAGALVAFLAKQPLWEGAAIGAGVGLTAHIAFKGN